MEGAGELKALWKDLSDLSGFPEPFLSGRRQIYNRWTKAYGQQLIREDIRDLTGIKSILDRGGIMKWKIPIKIDGNKGEIFFGQDNRIDFLIETVQF